MRIAIVAAGNVGTALSAAAVAAGHDVAVSATTKENAEEAAAAAGARAAADNADAVNGAEIVVLALPHAAVAEVANELGPALAGKVVVTRPTPSTPPSRTWSRWERRPRRTCSVSFQTPPSSRPSTPPSPPDTATPLKAMRRWTRSSRVTTPTPRPRSESWPAHWAIG